MVTEKNFKQYIPLCLRLAQTAQLQTN